MIGWKLRQDLKARGFFLVFKGGSFDQRKGPFEKKKSKNKKQTSKKKRLCLNLFHPPLFLFFRFPHSWSWFYPFTPGSTWIPLISTTTTTTTGVTQSPLRRLHVIRWDLSTATAFTPCPSPILRGRLTRISELASRKRKLRLACSETGQTRSGLQDPSISPRYSGISAQPLLLLAHHPHTHPITCFPHLL